MDFVAMFGINQYKIYKYELNFGQLCYCALFFWVRTYVVESEKPGVTQSYTYQVL